MRYKNFTDSNKGKKILIVGRGVSGIGAYSAAVKIGANPIMCDEFSMEGYFSTDFSLIVVSPAVEKTNKVFDYAKVSGTPIVSEIEFGYMINQNPIVAVTGTNGKTTTARLTAEMLSKKYKTALGGNIGYSYANIAAEGNYDIVVNEVSSFQAENIVAFKPDILMVTNISEDHLDRHKTIENYASLKLSLSDNMTKNDIMILSADDIKTGLLESFNPDCNVIYVSTNGKVDGAYLLEDRLYYCSDFIIHKDELSLKGEHNISNALFAVAAAKILNVKNEDIALVLKTFVPDDYRLSFSGEVLSVSFYNDSKGTNIAATLKAIKSMSGSTVLIAGGSDKGYDYDELFLGLSDNVVRVILMGETTAKMVSSAERTGYKNIEIASGLKSAVARAFSYSPQNVLLSPAAASFDAFRDYKERGRVFDDTVQELKDRVQEGINEKA